MKSLITLFFLLQSPYIFTQNTVADKILSDAQTNAGDQKKVFLKFSASWCGWCHKMDTAMSESGVKEIFDKYYVIAKLMVLESKSKKHLETNGGQAYLERYNGVQTGLPYWLIIDKTGSMIANSMLKEDGLPLNGNGENVGCPAKDDEIDYFIKVLKATSEITNKEAIMVRKAFEKIE